jgi:hypothetical protein
VQKVDEVCGAWKEMKGKKSVLIEVKCLLTHPIFTMHFLREISSKD